jgi:hypothetical protein
MRTHSLASPIHRSVIKAYTLVQHIGWRLRHIVPVSPDTTITHTESGRLCYAVALAMAFRQAQAVGMAPSNGIELATMHGGLAGLMNATGAACASAIDTMVL